MASILSTKHHTRPSNRAEGRPDNSSFARNKTGHFIIVSTTVGATAPDSHVASPTFVGTAAAQTIPPTTVQHAKNTNSSITTTQDSSPAPQTHRGIPSTEQYVRVERLWVLLQHHPQQDRVRYVLNGLLNSFSLEYEGERAFRAPDNLPLADTKPQLIRDRLQRRLS